MEAINLWELMLSAGTNVACVPEYKRTAIQEMALALSKSSFHTGQELSINVVEEGWLIKVFSCFNDTWEINVLIKKDGKVDVSVGRTETRAVDGN